MSGPSYAVVLWAHDRGDVLGEAAARWAAQADTVVAVDNRSDDGTPDLLAALADELEALRVVRTPEVVSDWDAARAGLAALEDVAWVHLGALPARPELERIPPALEAAGDAAALVSPFERRSPLGVALARPGAEWGEAPWRAGTAALATRLAALEPLSELASGAWLRRGPLLAAAAGPDRGPWTAEAWLWRAAQAGDLAYCPQVLCAAEERVERARDLEREGAATRADLARLLAELPPAWGQALAAWPGALDTGLETLRERDREWVQRGLLELDASSSRRDRWTAAALRALLDL